MATGALFEEEGNASRIPPAARVIPGFRSHGSLPKKPPVAVWNARYWVGQTQNEALPLIHSAVPHFSDAVFPKAVLPGRYWNLTAAVATDFAVLTLSLALSALLFAVRKLTAWHIEPGISLLLLYGTVLTLLAHSEGLYDAIERQWSVTQAVKVGKSVAWASLLVAAGYLANSPSSQGLASILLGAPLIYGGMLAWRWLFHLRAKKSGAQRNVLIVGADRRGKKLAALLAKDRYSGREVIGFVDDSRPVGGDIRGRFTDLACVARKHFADEIVLTSAGDSFQTRQVIREAQRNHLDVRIVPNFYGCAVSAQAMEGLSGVPTIALHKESMPVFGLRMKRLIDLACSGVTLVLTILPMAVIAVLIKLDSQGPVFYRAPRIGRKGRTFVCYKFRTMVVNAEARKEQLRGSNEREGPTFKITADPRITRLGRFLRRYSLDELPQLWNVLRGEMSLVGPRPHPVDDCHRYQMPHLRRLDVTPGITGLWQVTARHDPSFERNMALDLEYIENWNIWLDVKILLRTVVVVLQGSGA